MCRETDLLFKPPKCSWSSPAGAPGTGLEMRFLGARPFPMLGPLQHPTLHLGLLPLPGSPLYCTHVSPPLSSNLPPPALTGSSPPLQFPFCTTGIRARSCTSNGRFTTLVCQGCILTTDTPALHLLWLRAGVGWGICTRLYHATGSPHSHLPCQIPAGL